ncbi:HutD family protein [Duganella violaceipulchra]|uniref:Environmental stress-induced protein Ves n=1 Tax=Duganella violaceipulchra TaxID=2849652 RepID=A0AA41LBC3_9BURK|nr:HutD family protein [Duganella violaceicalia]MBV6325165.1 HutD family protein [Duganella violaceicalia]MCP2011591.1 environmental stress-induced protein Ves [Duganella violaceicalia]
MTQLIQYASLRPAPWKNGGGSTTEIAVSPAGAGFDEFDWRVSLATISQSGPFSSFPGIDRSLALVDGDGVLLDFGDERFVLSPSEPLIEFDGEAAVHATVTGGLTTDFNVMSRRGRCRHRIESFLVDGVEQLKRRSGTTLLFLADGESLTVSSARERIAMVRYDLLVLEAEQEWSMEAQRATVFVVDIINN